MGSFPDLIKHSTCVKKTAERGYYCVHGKIKAVADGAREGGLEF